MNEFTLDFMLMIAAAIIAMCFVGTAALTLDKGAFGVAVAALIGIALAGACILVAGV